MFGLTFVGRNLFFMMWFYSSLDFSGKLSLQGRVRVQVPCSVSSNFEVLALPAEAAGYQPLPNGFIREGQSPLEIKWTKAVALLPWLRQVTAQETDIPCSGWMTRLYTFFLTSMATVPMAERILRRESVTEQGESGMRDLTNMCFSGPEPHELAQPSNAFLQLFLFFGCGRCHRN